jgi:hypothetical protein
MTAVVRLEKEMRKTRGGGKRRGMCNRSGRDSIIGAIIINLRQRKSNRSDLEEGPE